MLPYNEHNFLVLLYVISLIVAGPSFSHGSMFDGKVLYAGKELWRETLPLQSGSQLYRLEGLKPYAWYEVKISYPASIPASFSLQLKKGYKDLKLNRNRRLLNTEKLIFKTESIETINDQGGLYVLVAVEPEGVVAIRNVQERQFIIYNIVCDELLLGIPYKAWWVVILVLVCLVVVVIVPRFLPSFLLPKDPGACSANHNFDKDS